MRHLNSDPGSSLLLPIELRTSIHVLRIPVGYLGVSERVCGHDGFIYFYLRSYFHSFPLRILTDFYQLQLFCVSGCCLRSVNRGGPIYLILPLQKRQELWGAKCAYRAGYFPDLTRQRTKQSGGVVLGKAESFLQPPLLSTQEQLAQEPLSIRIPNI